MVLSAITVLSGKKTTGLRWLCNAVMTAFVWGAYTQRAVDQGFKTKQTKNNNNWWVNMFHGFGCDMFDFFFFFLLSLFPFSMWFELLACRLLWVINTNECALFIFEILFWDVQAPCNRCLFIFIINNKSKDSLLFNLVKYSVWIVSLFNFLQPVKTFKKFYAGMINNSAPKGRGGDYKDDDCQVPKETWFLFAVVKTLNVKIVFWYVMKNRNPLGICYMF